MTLPTNSVSIQGIGTTSPAVESGKTSVVRLSDEIKEYQAAQSPPGASVYDTGWLNITPLVDVTSQGAQARRIGKTIHLRGVLANGATVPETAWGAGTRSIGTLPAQVGGSWNFGSSARTVAGTTPGGVPKPIQAWVTGSTVTIYQETATVSAAALSGLSGITTD